MKIFASLLFCFSMLYASAQKIENIAITQHGGEIIVQYDINGTINNNFNVSAYYSSDNKTWDAIEKAYGDVGDSISGGQSKKVVLWLDHLKNVTDKIYVKIKADYYTIDNNNTGNVKGKTGYLYTWNRFGENKWMAQNVKANKTDGECGGLFTNEAARSACPDNWHLATDEEWMALEIEFGVDKNKAKEHGLREINLEKLAKTGFVVEECNYKASLYPNQKALAFWTSSENKMLYTGYSDKYLARVIRLNENKISKELRNKSEELSVRCVQSANYLTSIEAVAESEIKGKPVSGETNHPFTGEKLDWVYVGNAIWLTKDLTGIYVYKEAEKACPTGWRLPEKIEWDNLISITKPSIKTDERNIILSERLSASGIWSLNLSDNDYWMNTDYYTYNTYWVNKKDKRESKKLIAFPSNKNGELKWDDKQTNENAKVRCVLDKEDFIRENASLKSGSFVDSRDKNEYGTIEIDNKIWMSDNLNFYTLENSTCRNNIRTDCELFGRMYNIEVANSGCPDGWRLPTSAEWKYLLINKAANNIKILYPFGGTGFNLLLGGEVIYDEDSKTDIYTANYLFQDGEKFGYYHIESNGKVELNEKAKKKDFYYIRCIK